MKKFKKVLAVLMAVVLLCCGMPFENLSIKANAVTFNELNSSSVFLKQAGTSTCTLCSCAMMMRRYSMLRGDSGWSTITESSIKPSAWVSGSGLRWSFSYSNSSVSSISVGTYDLPGGSANEAKIQQELKNCPEGIVLYYHKSDSEQHAVLLTDYKDGVYYCADPLGSRPSGRIPLSSAYLVSINSAYVKQYWKVTSPVVPGPTDHTTVPNAPVVSISSTELVVGEEAVLSWSAAANADYYWISCWSDTEHVINESSDKLNKTISFSKPGKYSITVVAYNDIGEAIGNWIDITVYEKPSKPVVKSIVCNQDGSVTVEWTPCKTNTLAYSIRFYKANSTDEFKFLSWVTKETSYTYYGLPAGKYQVRITAEGEGGWTHGDCSAIFEIPKPQKPTVTSIVCNQDGSVTLKWTPCKTNTLAYSIRFYKANSAEEFKFLSWITKETSYTYYGLPSGKYYARVTAEGNLDFTHSDYTEEFEVKSPKFFFDLQGRLDGNIKDNLSSFGTVDIYINNTLVANDVNDYSSYFDKETAYEIKDIKAKSGYKYNGIHNGNLSGKINEYTYIVLDFATNSSTLKVDPNGGKWNGFTSVQTFKQNYNTTKDIPIPVRTGYTFTGWVRSGTNGKLSSTTLSATYTYGPSDNVTDTITATWRCNHAKTTLKDARSATCTSEGYTGDTYCADCGTKISTGRSISKTAHSYGSWVITKKATCVNTGTQEKTCTYCKDKVTQSIPTDSTNHTGSFIIKEQKEATCTREGYTGDKYCLDCQAKLSTGNTIPKISHSDKNNDGKCDSCGTDLGTKPSDPQPEPTNPTCSHLCHKGGFLGFIWNIINFFNKLFRSSQYCSCGAKHW